MRSEEEIRERLEQYENRCSRLKSSSERRIIVREMRQLEWVLNE